MIDAANGDWILACLAVMALALVVMAVGQLALAVVAARVARQATTTVQEFQRDIRPVIEKVQKIADDASKTSAIALVQAERVDLIMQGTVRRVDETMSLVQDAVAGPLRHGSAVVAGIRAALDVLRGVSERRRRGREDEDALFIG